MRPANCKMSRWGRWLIKGSEGIIEVVLKSVNIRLAGHDADQNEYTMTRVTKLSTSDQAL